MTNYVRIVNGLSEREYVTQCNKLYGELFNKERECEELKRELEKYKVLEDKCEMLKDKCKTLIEMIFKGHTYYEGYFTNINKIPIAEKAAYLLEQAIIEMEGK